ncbi:MAG: DNRLRE domain-containing protein, partial [Anaerolineae bacterium]
DTWDFTTTAAPGPKTWDGSVSSDWHTAANWTPSGVPTSNDDVTIPDVTNDPVMATSDAQVNSLTVHEGAMLDLTDRTLTVEGTLTNNGTLKQTRGVAEGTTTQFLRITNTAGTQTKYHGVDMTPSSIRSTARLAKATASPTVGIRETLQPYRTPDSEPPPSDGRLPLEAPATYAVVGPTTRSAHQGTLYSTADSTVLEGYPSSNFGATGDMWAGYDELLDPPGQIVRSLVRFDTASLPSEQEITTATLRLHLISSWDYPDTSRTITTYRAASTWSEDGVTWNNQPGSQEAYGANSIVSGAWGWYEFDVTDLVVAWVEGTYPNHGIIVRGPEVSGEDASWRAFGTQESDHVPELIMDYSGPNTPPSEPSNPSPANGATEVSTDADLSWTGGDPNNGDSVTYEVYLGTSSPPPLVASIGPYSATQTSLTYDPGTLEDGTQYFWYVVAKDNQEATTTGDTWEFHTTGCPDFRTGQWEGAADFTVSNDRSRVLNFSIDITAGTCYNGELTADELPIENCQIQFAATDGDAQVSGGGTFVSETEMNGWLSVFRPSCISSGSWYAWWAAPSDPPNAPSDPSPADGATEVSINADLSWTGGDPNDGDSVTYEVYLGTSSPPPLVATIGPFPATQTSLTYDPGTLTQGTQYVWYIVATDNLDVSTTGDTWTFTTTMPVNTPPTLSDLPDQDVPMNGSADNAIDLWAYADDAEDGDDALSFTITNDPATEAGVSIDGDRYIDINPTADWTGETEVQIQVEDTGGLTDSDTFQVSVQGTEVTVSVSGNQFCSGRDSGVKRCFDIETDAAVRFYFSGAERNGMPLEDLLVFHYIDEWTEEPGPYTRGGAGDGQYVEAQNVDDFSLFALDSAGGGFIYLPLVLRRYPPIPDIPVLNAISNPDGDGNYTVSWKTASLADEYVLEEDDNRGFSSPTERYSGPGLSWDATGKAPGTYHYRVKARNAYGDSGWSNIESVAVAMPELEPCPADTIEYLGTTSQNRPVKICADQDFSTIKRVMINYSISCSTPDYGAATVWDVPSSDGWPIEDRAFFVEAQYMFDLDGTFAPGFASVSGTWQGIEARCSGFPGPCWEVCRGPVGQWSATRQP